MAEWLLLLEAAAGVRRAMPANLNKFNDRHLELTFWELTFQAGY